MTQSMSVTGAINGAIIVLSLLTSFSVHAGAVKRVPFMAISYFNAPGEHFTDPQQACDHLHESMGYTSYDVVYDASYANPPKSLGACRKEPITPNQNPVLAWVFNNYYCPGGWRPEHMTYSGSIFYDNNTVVRYFWDDAPSCVRNGVDPEKDFGMCNSPGQRITKPFAGNPINVASGNKFAHEIDLPGSGMVRLGFARYYNSFQSEHNAYSKAPVIGYGWRHNYMYGLRLDETSTISTVTIKRPQGNSIVFTLTGEAWQSDSDIRLTLRRLTGNGGASIGWQLNTIENSVELYDAQGRLSSITDMAGNAQRFTYDEAARLMRVDTNAGDYLVFGYDGANRINALTDRTNRTWHYRYDSHGNLEYVDNPDATSKRYHYESATLRHVLTGITDERGVRYATYGYDSAGRAIYSTHAGDAHRVDVAYNTNGTSTVTNAFGKKSIYTFTTILGVDKVVRVEGLPSADCAGANQLYTYDTNGFLASKTDWNGITTTYTHDTQGRELSRTEAAGTPEARTVTTEWHSQWRLPVRISEPGKVTVFTYDDKGQLLSRNETAAP